MQFHVSFAVCLPMRLYLEVSNGHANNQDEKCISWSHSNGVSIHEAGYAPREPAIVTMQKKVVLMISEDKSHCCLPVEFSIVFVHASSPSVSYTNGHLGAAMV